MPLLRCWSRQQRQQHHRRPCLTKLCTILVACCWLSAAQGFTVSSSTPPSHPWALHSSTSSSPYSTVSPLTQQRRAAKAASATADVVMSEAQAGESRRTLVVIGGGAAGYFGAIQAASSSSSSSSSSLLRVVVLEAGKLPLQKVKISGGGRCNVMHDTSKAVSLIAKGYPRGGKQLIGPFKSLFGPAEAAGWFGARGVSLKTEGDGRMFPITDDSQTIIDCLEGAARKADVQVTTSARVMSIAHKANRNDDNDDNDDNDNNDIDDSNNKEEQPPQQQQQHFDVSFTTATPLSQAVRSALGATLVAAGSAGKSERSSYRISCDYVLQATGAAREGHGWAKRLGHAVSAPVPSLFTLTIRDPRLKGLAGLSVQDAELKLLEEKPKGEEGSSAPNGKSYADGTVGGGDTTNTTAAGQAQRRREGVGAESESSESNKKSRNKNKAGKKKLTIVQRGPLLITHSGVSGPAALKLSAFGARVLNEGGYRGKLVVNWLAGNNPSRALEDLQAFRTGNPKKTVYAFCPIGGPVATGASDRSNGARPPPSSSALPRRLWQSLALAAGVEAGDKWAEMSKAKLSALAQQLTACNLQIVGKGSFKEEFVTCGGVELSDLDMRTMESRRVPGLFFAGEVVDIDGVTGGFNFQSAWTTGWVAGTAIGARAAEAGTAVGAAVAAVEIGVPAAAGSTRAGGAEAGLGAAVAETETRAETAAGGARAGRAGVGGGAAAAAAGAGVAAAAFEHRGLPNRNREDGDREGAVGGAGRGRRAKAATNGRREERR